MAASVKVDRPAAEIYRPHRQELPRARVSSTELRFCHECKEAGRLYQGGTLP